jgi:short-subunit dehydrogenase
MRSPGAIVNTISLGSITLLAGSSVYSGTKFALRGFNIALHMEMKPRGITVSGVLPGAIDSGPKRFTIRTVPTLLAQNTAWKTTATLSSRSSTRSSS